MADPLSLALMAGSAAGGLASLLGPKPSTPQAPVIPGPPPPTLSPSGSSTSSPNGAPNSGNPSFLAAAAAPQGGQLASKSLLGS